MSILTRIDDIPLFNNSQRAMEWGRQFGLKGFHTHVFQDQTGYMAGNSHSQVMQAVSKGPQVIRQVSSPSRSSSGGGGY